METTRKKFSIVKREKTAAFLEKQVLFITARSVSAVMILAGSIGCAPEVSRREYQPVATQFGPQLEEREVAFSGVKPSGLEDSLHLDGQISSAEVFRIAEGLIDLGRTTGSEKIVGFGIRISDAFYQADGVATRSPFTRSPFVSAAIGETFTQTIQLVDELDGMLVRDAGHIGELLKKVGSSYPWSRSGSNATEIIENVEGFIAAFDRSLSATGLAKIGLDPRVVRGVREGLRTEAQSRLNEIKKEIFAIYSEPTASALLARFRKFLSQNNFALDAATMTRMERGEDVLRRAEAIADAEAALVVLIDLWRMSSDAVRSKSFKAASPELYEFLRDRNEAELACLRLPLCLNPVAIFMRGFGLIPKLNQYGVERLRSDISSASKTAIISEIESRATELLPELPDMIEKQILAEIIRIRQGLSRVSANYDEFMRGLAARFEQNHLVFDQQAMELGGVEAAQVKIFLRGGIVKISPSETKSDTPDSVITSAEAVGSSMALAPKRWAELWPMALDPLEMELSERGALLARQEKVVAREVLTQINKLLAIGGFKTEKRDLFPSMSVSLNPDSLTPRLDVRRAMDIDEGFAVPDRLLVGSDFKSETLGPLSVSASGQAEMLRGIARLIRFFRDWEKNEFDRTLGSVEVGSLIRDLPARDIKQKFLPKELMFSAAVGNAAVILKNFAKPMTPVFLLNLQRKVVWSNEVGLSQGSPATMAGIVDLVAGQRSDLVRSRDVARFIFALIEILESLEGIEKTSAAALLVKGKSGFRPVDQLIESRAQLRMLVVALANFLSHRMQGQEQSKDGGISVSYSRRQAGIVAGQNRQLLDQALAGHALLRAGLYLGKDVYRWAALDVMSFLNAKMWDSHTGFYRPIEGGAPKGPELEGSSGRPGFESIVAVLNFGEALRPVMSPKGQAQWKKISEPWISALESR